MSARFAGVAPAGRHTIRDARGRFARGTEAQRLGQDVAEAQREFGMRQRGGGPQFGVFAGRLTGRQFAIRRGEMIGLYEQQIRATVNASKDFAIQLLYDRLVATSPVDTGLLRSQWRADRLGVSNAVPYVRQTEFVNRRSRGYIRRAVSWTLRHAQVKTATRAGAVIQPGKKTQTVRL